MRFYDVELWEPDSLLKTSDSSFYVQIFGGNNDYGGQGISYMRSDQLNEKYFIDFTKIHSFHYTNYDNWARCMADVGCVEI